MNDRSETAQLRGNQASQAAAPGGALVQDVEDAAAEDACMCRRSAVAAGGS